MKASLIAVGLLSVALTHCSGDRGLFVGSDKGGGTGDGGEDTGGSGGNGNTGGTSSGSGGDSNVGGSSSEAGGTSNRGGSSGEATGGNGAESQGGNAGEAGTAGTPASGGGGTDAGGGGGTGGEGAGGTGEPGGTGGVAGTAGEGSGGVATGGVAGTNRGGSGGSGGSPTDCDALAREYLERLAAAQQCTPTVMPTDMTQCSRQMPDDLICGCPTYVNPARESDVRRMNEIIELAKGCSRVCPAIACPLVTRGVCTGDTSITAARGRCRGAP